ncbi:hypothetical protein Afil01_27680 [Actinorhabdospora filicis]|uniref:DUF3592 domain-containing protein n=1 Tax=Actinorhabdospora filicis TaxID=1785913 RepID=A0A9W6W9V8_9ACTN|nr:DUF3592 domain-containing protein [Actinorhabdospora filicis]GLZ77961.1 hypothetical protein Afil01_27680 [Actinorhabdospora filicis]
MTAPIPAPPIPTPPVTGSRWRLGYLLFGVLLMVGALSVVIGARFHSEHADTVRELRNSGTPVTATVTKVEISSGRSGGTKRFKLRYEQSGGRGAWVNCEPDPCPAVDDTVRIWVDPDDPYRFVDERGRLAVTDPGRNDGRMTMVFGMVMAGIGVVGLISLAVFLHTGVGSGGRYRAPRRW